VSLHIILSISEEFFTKDPHDVQGDLRNTFVITVLYKEGFPMAFVPYGKQSKKKRREMDRAKRAEWGNISPVTKKIASRKVYDRKKTQRWQEPPVLGFLVH